MSGDTLTTNRLLHALRQARDAVEQCERSRREPIAIIGIGCRFPGNADDPEAYWRVLHDGVDAVGQVPPDRWDNDSIYHPDRRAAGKTYTGQGAFIRFPDGFDAEFFGISPREAACMDPQQRLLLEVSWQALEDAGLAAASLSGRPGGVYIGIGQSHYGDLQLNPLRLDTIDAHAGTGSLLCFASGRLSHWLGLTGPSLSIDTACSSSLVAAHLACQSLRAGEVEMALVGGVHLNLAPHVSLFLSRAGALSPDGRTKAFDAAADGFGRGEGCAVIVLKRLSDAQAAGDRIHALIRGSAVDHDGGGAGLTVPNESAQVKVIQDALANAQVEAGEVDYVEAHGTGTELGDPIELRALARVFSPNRSREHPLFLGTVKSNIGHLEAAAGLAGLIKAVLALQHRQIPVQCHFRDPNPHIPWQDLPFIIPKTTRPWPEGGDRRFAGISAFGMSGTNAHLVLEEAAPTAQDAAKGSELLERPLHLLVLSARSQSALQVMLSQYRHHLLTHPDENLADICSSAAQGRSAFEHRVALVCASRDEAVRQLEALAQTGVAKGAESGRVSGEDVSEGPVFLFTGQGSQFRHMGRELYQTQPCFRAAVDRCAAILEPVLERPLLEVLYGDGGSGDLLDRADFAQPALFTLQYGLAAIWQSWGIRPSAVLGHSLGEYAAACVAGVFSLEDGLLLVAERGRLMHRLPGNGAMAALICDDLPALEQWLDNCGEDVFISARNSPRELILSGSRASLRKVLARLEQREVLAGELAVSHAFHSPLMEPMLSSLRPAAERVTYLPSQVDMLSSVDGQWNRTGQVDYWCRQLLRPVDFKAAMAELADRGYRQFLEIGPRPILTELARACLPDKRFTWLASMAPGRSDWRVLLHSLARLFVGGMALDGEGFDRGYHRQRVRLPTYPFQRSRHWLPTAAPNPSHSGLSGAGDPVHPLVGRRIPLPGSREIRFETRLDPSRSRALRDHRVFGLVIVAAAYHLALVLEAAATSLKATSFCLEDIRLLRPLLLPEGKDRRIQVVFEPADGGGFRFAILSCHNETDAGSPDSWSRHVDGRLRTLPPAERTEHAVTPRRGDEETTVDGSAFYAELERIGFALGPSYRWTRQLHCSQGMVRCSILAPEGPWDQQDTAVHPGLLDTCFQALSRLWPHSTEALHLSGMVYVPFTIGEIRIHALPVKSSVPLHCWGYTESEPGDADNLPTSAGLHLSTAEGVTILEVRRFQFRRATRASIDIDSREQGDDLLELRWIAESTPPTLLGSGSGRWLIVADQGGLGQALSERLGRLGHRCQLLGHEHSLVGMQATSLEGVVYLRALDRVFAPRGNAATLTTAALDTLEEIQTLVKALSGAARAPRLWLVTRGTQAVSGGIDWSALAQAPSWGLGAVLAAEHGNLQPTCIDLDPQPSEEDAHLLAMTLANADREDWIALRGGRRHLGRLMALPPPAKKNMPIRAHGTYLLTGGVGGLGLKLAAWLVDQGARHLVLSSRNPVRPEAASFIAKLEQGGARVVCHPADIGEADQAASLFAAIDASLPPLCGVIHAAGVVDDALLLDQNRERVAKVLAPKVAGAWHLHCLTKDRPLDFLVFFASAATLIGARGQSGYAMANTFLDALAHARRAIGLPALSLDWGAWAEIGMAATMPAREQQRWRQRGFNPIEPNRGVELLGSLLGGDMAQVAILPMDRQAMVRSGILFPPRFDHLVQPEHPARRPSSLPSQLDAIDPEQRWALLEQHTRLVLAETLGLKQPERIEPRTRLFDLGFDSILALETAERLERELATPLHATLLFEYPTLERLVDYLASAKGLLRPDPEQRKRKQARALSVSEADLATLSEDEAERLLREQLQNLGEQ